MRSEDAKSDEKKQTSDDKLFHLCFFFTSMSPLPSFLSGSWIRCSIYFCSLEYMCFWGGTLDASKEICLKNWGKGRIGEGGGVRHPTKGWHSVLFFASEFALFLDTCICVNFQLCFVHWVPYWFFLLPPSLVREHSSSVNFVICLLYFLKLCRIPFTPGSVFRKKRKFDHSKFRYWYGRWLLVSSFSEILSF